jgi:nitrate reductase assembly molybdenum cofactor insertion protein NarJ
MTFDDLQGIFSYNFEISSGEYTLDLGYHLLDGFKRATKLLSLKEIYRENGFPIDEVSKGELPDNLPIVLKFLDFVQDDEVRLELREDFLIKALEKLSKNYEKKQDSPYAHLVKALLIVVDSDVKAETTTEEEAGEEATNAE